MKKFGRLLFLLFVSATTLSAQKWVTMMTDTNANYYDIVKEFEAYWKDKDITEKGKGYKAFRRWQWFVEPRVYPSGNMKYASRTYALEQLMLEEKKKGKLGSSTISATVANWVPLGPFGSPQGGDAGRVQSIALHPAGTNTFYVGTAAGGFWMTYNGGTTYSTTTDQLGSCGVSDIAVNPANPSIIYISTGDKDAGDTHSTGVMKSINGGNTWASTGLVWQTSQQRRIYRLLINPQNPNTLIAATSVGIYRTLDAGVTWSLVSGGSYVDAEYKPGDTTVVYAVTAGSCVRSTNGGASFSNVPVASTGLNSTRLSLAVTPANNNYVYILVGSTNNGFGGLYRSVNGASSFSLMSTTPNIMDWSTNGGGTGGQAWYDIALAASPTNADEIIAGGVNTWRSQDGGSSWALHTHWTGGGGRPYVHADCHHISYASGTTIFIGTDGGVARSTTAGALYTTINGNMNIAQIYKLGVSAQTPTRIITGHQDNGSNLMTGTSWAQEVGGDGMDCFISYANFSVMVASTQNGGFRRSTNAGASWSGITNGLSGNAPWVSPIVQDPVVPTTFYCGYSNVFKSTNQGSSWTMISNIGTSIDEIKVAPSNNQIIYVTNGSGVWKTTNGGTSWSSIGSAVIQGGQITDLAVDNQNPNNIYVTVSGYSAGNKVFVSSNGGASWTNYSNGLPNIPVNCIVFKNFSPQALYVGTDVGVYYREGSMNSWIPYSNGLPNIVVDDLEIHYASGKLRAATYARGVWETDLYSDPAALPVSAFFTTFSPGCINVPLQFNDLSANTPTAWSWAFQSGSPATSTLQNPQVTYSSPGTYTVSLVSGNANGTSSAFVTTVTVVNAPTVSPTSASVCYGQAVSLTANTNAGQVNWMNGQQGPTIFITAQTTTVYTYTASTGACSVPGTASLVVSPLPSAPTVTAMPGYLTTTVTGVTYQWYKSGSIVSGATSPTFVPTQSGYYSLWISNGNCSSSSPYVFFEVPDNVQAYAADEKFIKLVPNPVNEELTVTPVNNEKIREYTILNSLGQVVEKSIVPNDSGELKIQVSGLAKGQYYLSVSTGKRQTTLPFIKH